MTATKRTEYGSITISDNAIATISGLSVMETYGIVGMAAKNAADGFLEMLKSDNLTKGIKVNSEGDDLSLDIYIITQYGVNISVVAENLKEKVRFNVEKYTGLKVPEINLVVQGIRTNK